MPELTGLQPSLLEMGPANIYYGSGAVHLGFCANVKLKLDRKFKEMTGGQYGDMPVDHRLQGINGMIYADLQQITLEMLQRALAGAVQTFVDDTDPTKRRLEFQANVGSSLRAAAQKILVKPIDGGSETTNKERWVAADICVPTSAIELPYTASDQQKISTEWFAYADPTKRNRAIYLGDDSAVDATTPFGI